MPCSCVCSVYLSEIISHKRNADALYLQAGGDFDEIAHRDALYHGTQNANVFVGAYANRRASGLESDFQSFMSKQAPYRTE